MALNGTQQWWIRADGDELNGGGYDAAVSGAGVNYSDQAAAQLSLTDVVTTGTTTVSSVTGGFTSNMIGNIIRIAGDDYYMITARASTNSITVDRTTGTATGQSARVGGAHPGFVNYASGGTATQPAMTTPLTSGHTINVRGSGSDNGSADYTQSGYYEVPGGDPDTNGRIQVLGYNGRPCFSPNGLMFYNTSYWTFRHIKLLPTGVSSVSLGVLRGTSGLVADDILCDVNGLDVTVFSGALIALNCHIFNTGSTTAGSLTAVIMQPNGGAMFGCSIRAAQSDGVLLTNGGSIRASVISDLGNGHAIMLSGNNATPNMIIEVTVDNVSGSGVSSGGPECDSVLIIRNCIFSNCGAYGLDLSSSAPTMGLLISDYNDFWSNTSGDYHFVTAGPNDLALDPQFTDAGSGDYTIGTNLKAKGTPVTLGV